MRIAVALVVLSAGVVVAEPPGVSLAPPGMTPLVEPTAPPAPPLEPSYRGQTLTADGIAVGLLLVGISTNNEGVGDLSLGAYALGGPIVHLAHHRPGRAAGSLALRVGLPIIGGLIGAKQDGCHGDVCGDGSAIALGILTGMVGAIVIDAAFLAEGDHAPPPPAWSPAVTASRGGVALGLAGSF